MSGTVSTAPASPSILVVGAGARFYSGVSLYTALLVRTLSSAGAQVSAVLARQLCPSRLYPGRDRLGQRTTAQLPLPTQASVCDTLDWWPSRGTVAAYRFVWRAAPQVLVLQWWTATLLHHYVLLAALCRLRRARVVIEFHETQDVSELAIPLVRLYTRSGLWLLAGMSSFALVHSQDDALRVRKALPLGQLPIHVVLHGPYPAELLPTWAAGREDFSLAPRPLHRRTQVDSVSGGTSGLGEGQGSGRSVTHPPEDVLRLLYFGVVRHYKGVDVLAEAACRVSRPVQLVVAGEPWDEGAQQLLARLGEHGATVFASYVDDELLVQLLAWADLVVLPYLRASASGPMAMTMAAGVPMVVSDLPALREAAQGYGGARFAPAGDADALARTIEEAAELVGRRFEDPRSWEDTARQILQLLEQSGPEQVAPVAAQRTCR